MVIIVSFTHLQQLKAGELTSAYRLAHQQLPITRLQISASDSQQQLPELKKSNTLHEFPREILDLADCLEVLDLSNHHLNALPDDFDRLINLRILFLTNNDFERIPAVLARCPKLEMISFKSNALTVVDEYVLPVDTRWLILTDNRIETLPHSMGQLHRLQKLALAGNCLTHLPDSMAKCESLELARLSANKLIAMPDWLFHLPKLAWLAFSGNEFNCISGVSSINEQAAVIDVPLADIELGALLGEGASGLIYRGDWLIQPQRLIGTDNHIAVKIFKGDVTSDGYPQDELDCCLTAGEQENLIKVVAQLDQTDANKKLGLVMELIPKSFYNLGLPPTLITCTRDTFTEGTIFNIKTLTKIVLQMANTMTHLHKNAISHGDVYAHNTMVNDQGDMLFGDFGAATNLASLPKHQQQAMERIEVRAFGYLLDDMLQLNSAVSAVEKTGLAVLVDLKNQCLSYNCGERPNFEEIQQRCQSLMSVVQSNGVVDPVVE